MTWKLILSKRAKKKLTKLNKNLKSLLNSAMVEMLRYYEGKGNKKPDIKILKGRYKGIMRLRVGKYRILFKMSMRHREIFIIEILSRSDLY